jgi:hypothetical protein
MKLGSRKGLLNTPIPFNPGQLAGLALWVSAAHSPLFQSNAGTTASVSNGDVVGYIGDLSGNAKHLKSAADDTTRPTLQTNSGNKCIRFDGTNDLVGLHTAGLGIYQAGACSVFAAVKANPGTNKTFLSEASSTGATTIYEIISNTGTATQPAVFLRDDSSNNPLNGSSNTPALADVFGNTDVVFGHTDSATQIVHYYDQYMGAQFAYTRPGGVISIDRFGIGGLLRGSAAGWMAMDLYELIIVSGRVVSDVERTNIITWLGKSQGRNISPTAKGQTSLRQVATRTRIPSSRDLTNKQFNSRSWHIARDDITSLQIGFPNWFSATGVDQAIGGIGTVFAAIEYPAATFTRVTWNGGSTSVAIADFATAISDALTISIPNGSTFYVRFFYSGATAAPSSGLSIEIDTARGDAINIAASGLSDLTMGGTITNNGSGYIITPCCIIAQTFKPAVAILGDSIAAGANDSYSDASGDIGSIARSIGAQCAYMNLGISSEQLTGFITVNSKRRIQLAQYTTHVILGDGRNDLFSAHRTSAQYLADAATLRKILPNHKFIETTKFPSTSSTDSWATVGNQTTLNATDETNRVSVNTAIRANIAGVAQFGEIADVVESARNSGKFATTGAGTTTADGIHPSNGLDLSIKGAIDPKWITG